MAARPVTSHANSPHAFAHTDKTHSRAHTAQDYTNQDSINHMNQGPVNGLDARHYERLLATSAALAGAPDLENFAHTLLAASLEFTGATRAFLILDQEGAWAVAAGARRAPVDFQMHPALPLTAAQASLGIAVDTVSHAIRSRRTRFQHHSPIWQTSQPAEPADTPAPRAAHVFCTPLLYDGQVIAVLYLEMARSEEASREAAYSEAAFSELAVQLIARISQQAAPRLHSLQEIGRLAELVQLRREMTEALRASEERFRSIFNSSPVMIFLTDVAGRLIMVNDYWLQALGYSRVEAVSREVGDFCTVEGRALLAHQLQPAPQPGHQYENLPIQFVRRNGALLDALVSGVILHSEIEGYTQCLSFAIDMTAHRRAEAELDRYRRRLEELVRERTHELSAANRQLEQDIQRRKAAEAQLLRSQQFLQATIDALSEKLAILDARGAIVALNSSWRNTARADGAPSGTHAPGELSGELAYWQGYQVGADYLRALQGASHARRAAQDKPVAQDEDQTTPEPVAPSPVAPEIVRAVEQGLDELQQGGRNFFQIVYQLQATGRQSEHDTGRAAGRDTGRDTDSKTPPATAPAIGEPGAQTPTWYSLRAMRFQSGGETYIAVAHDDVTDRKEAEQALLEAAAVNERHRLARELHDSVTQALYSMALFVDATRLALDAGQVTRATDNLGELRAMSRGAMENMRALIFELHPPELAEIGLVGALREYLKNYEHRTQIDVDFGISGVERAFPVRTESEIYRVAQEALSNCFKHARADHVAVGLRYDRAGLDLEIADNGQGFQVNLAHLNGGLGLRGMHERIRSIGGRIEVDSRPDQGTTVRVRLGTEMDTEMGTSMDTAQLDREMGTSMGTGMGTDKDEGHE